jgi:hypothetical protein
MTIVSLEISLVKIGSINIEGLMSKEGEFFIGLSQVSELGFVPPNRSQKQLETLLGIRFQSHQKAKTKLNPKAVNVISLDDFQEVIKAQAKKGHQKAIEFAVILMGQSLHQIFCDTFKVKFDEDDRHERLVSRLSGVVTRRTLTDSIKDWLLRNPGGTQKPEWLMYAETTNTVYQVLWGLTAEQIEDKIDCPRHKLRDYLLAESLKELERAEANVTEFIDCDNIKPTEAVKLANIRKKPLTFRTV